MEKINPYMKVQITNQIMAVKNFEKLVEIAAEKDDGVIDKFEEKTIKRAQKAAERYIKILNKLLGDSE